MESISKDLTSALVDNELHDEALKNQLVSQMETDADLRYDYMVQSLVKNLIKEKVRFHKTPDKVSQESIKKNSSERNKIRIKDSLFCRTFFQTGIFFFNRNNNSTCCSFDNYEQTGNS